MVFKIGSSSKLVFGRQECWGEIRVAQRHWSETNWGAELVQGLEQEQQCVGSLGRGLVAQLIDRS